MKETIHYLILSIFLAILIYLSFQVGQIKGIQTEQESYQWKTQATQQINTLTQNVSNIVNFINQSIEATKK